MHFSDKHNPTFDVWRGPPLPSPFMDLNHLKEENFVKNDFDYVTQVCYATPLRFLEYQMCSLERFPGYSDQFPFQNTPLV